MGMFDKNSKDQLAKEFNEISKISLDKETITDLAQRYPNNKLFLDTAKTIYNTKSNITEEEYSHILRRIPTFYDNILDSSIFLNVVRILTKNPELMGTDIISKISYAFNDKSFIYEILLFITQSFQDALGPAGNLIVLDEAVSYLVSARRHYVDDRALLSSFFDLINKIGLNTLKYGTVEDIDKEIAMRLIEDKRADGIYSISQEELEFMEQKAEELGIKSEQLNTLVNMADSSIKSANAFYEEIRRNQKNFADQQIKELDRKAEAALRSFDEKYMELVNAEKRGILVEKDSLLASLQTSIGKEKSDLISFLHQTKLEYQKELENLKKEQKEIFDNFDKYIEGNQTLKDLIATSKSDQAFIDRMTLIEEVANKLKEQGILDGNNGAKLTPISESTPRNLELGKVSSEGSTIILPNNSIITGPDLGISDPVDYSQIYYFDFDTPFRKRFKDLMEKKKAMIANGEIFHECFDDVLTIVLHNDVPYLYGPSGTGKTHMIKEQLFKLLGIDVITNGYISFEQDVLGYTNAANGGYVPSNFYRAFLYGKGLFFDELDNSNSKAATVLNSFITGKRMDGYTFPNGVTVKRHPNFRIIAAGNTKGEGRDIEYSSRQKLDESVLQRIWAVECGYQNDIENKILKDYEAWAEFAVSFRKAIESIQLNSDNRQNSSGTFTTRDASDVQEYLSDESFNYKKLIKYKFIQTKDYDYLKQIYAEMDADSKNYKKDDTKKLLIEFKNQMDKKAVRAR